MVTEFFRVKTTDFRIIDAAMNPERDQRPLRPGGTLEHQVKVKRAVRKVMAEQHRARRQQVRHPLEH
jgi:hypothetical protein